MHEEAVLSSSSGFPPARVVSRRAKEGCAILERDDSERVGKEKDDVREVRLGRGKAGREASWFRDGLASRPMMQPAAPAQRLAVLFVRNRAGPSGQTSGMTSINKLNRWRCL